MRVSQCAFATLGNADAIGEVHLNLEELLELQQHQQKPVSPLSFGKVIAFRSNSDQQQISPRIISPFSVSAVMRIKDMITQHEFR